MSSPRTVLHLDLDTFFVSVERLMDSRLNGKPLLIGGTGDRGVVASCSYEARKFGVHSGMPMRMARELCPEALVIRGNLANYSKHSTPSPTSSARPCPSTRKAPSTSSTPTSPAWTASSAAGNTPANSANASSAKTGLPISFGLSENKTVSKVATGEAKPNNALRIERGTERPSWPRWHPQDSDGRRETYQTLRNLGVRRIGTLRRCRST